MTNTNKALVGDIFNGVVPAIWVSLGFAVLICAIFCTMGAVSGMGAISGMGSILQCAVGCYMFGGILIASGYVWYNRVTK